MSRAEYDEDLNIIRTPSGQRTPPPGYYVIVDGLLERFDPKPGEWPPGVVYRIEEPAP